MNENNRHKIKSYPLRLAGELRDWATERAAKNKRSLNAELNLLIERAKEKEEAQESA